MADTDSSSIAPSESEIPSEMELCSNAVFACSAILNARWPQFVEELGEIWCEVKQEVMRDLLLLWSGENNPDSELNSSTRSLLREGNAKKMVEAYTRLLDSRALHFGGENCPRLFLIDSPNVETEPLVEYLLAITRWNDNVPIPFNRIPLHQISSVYDEILDYTPTILQEPRKWKMSQGMPVLKLLRGDEEADLEQGEIGLLRLHSRDEDVSERDKKGAFYTPYNVALDIVERTLSPLIEGKSSEQILELNICDPALGSGVFLLAASEFLAEAYCDLLQEEGGVPNELSGDASISAHCRYEVTRDCVYGVDIDGTAIVVAEGILACAYQDGSLPLIDFSERLKVGNSMLGVPLQQWVTIPTVAHSSTQMRRRAKDANEVYFQSQELRRRLTGINREKSQLQQQKREGVRPAKQQTLFQEQATARRNSELQMLNNEAKVIAEQINNMQRGIPSDSLLLHNELRTNYPLDTAIDFLDTHLSTWWLGEGDSENDLTTENLPLYAMYLLSKHGGGDEDLYGILNPNGDGYPVYPDHYENMLNQARNTSQEQMFFHWELEFQEVFLAPSGNCGFDAVIGNPPWGITLDSVQHQRFKWAYPLSGDKETAWAFIEIAMHLVRPERGRIGYIVPNTFLLNISSEKLREYILDEWILEELLDYSQVAIFEGAGVRSCQLHIRKFRPEPDMEFVYHRPDLPIPTEGETRLNLSVMRGRTHWGRPEIELPINLEDYSSIGECCVVRQGYKPYVKGKFAKRDLSDDEVARILAERPYHHNEPDEGRILELDGADVRPFCIKIPEQETWVDHVDGAVAELMSEEFRSGRRIVVREIAGTPPRYIIAAETELEFVHDPTIIMIRPKEGYEQLYDIIELYLNSIVTEDHVKYLSAKVGKGLFGKFTINDIRRLPIPYRESLTPEILAQAADIIAELKQGDELDEEALQRADEFIATLYPSDVEQ